MDMVLCSEQVSTRGRCLECCVVSVPGNIQISLGQDPEQSGLTKVCSALD